MRRFLILVVCMCLFALPGCGGAASVHVPGQSEAQGAVYNVHQQVWYDALEDAFEQAADGDAIYVYEDVEAAGIATTAEKLSVDLQGHSVEIDTVGTGARGGQGLAHGAIELGVGEYSFANGTITARVGAQPETAQSATTPYCGISAGHASNVTLDNVKVDVTYAGTSTIAPSVELVGADAGGAFAMRGGSEIEVTAAAVPETFGATTVAGVRLSGGEGATADVSADSSIRVVNESSQILQGAIGYPGAIYGTTKESNAELMEIAVDPSLDWYEDLLARFLANAQFDDRADNDGYLYGAEVYYAPSLELASGMKVWAFSNPVAAGAAGTQAAIVPSHVFARSDYALPLDAYGIWCAEDFVGTVKQEGRVSAVTTLGHAVGILESEGGAYELDEDAVATSCEEGVFRSKAGAFDLGDFVDLPVGPETDVAYPQQSTYTAIRQENSGAWAAATADEAHSYVTAPIAFDDLFADWDELGAKPASSEDDDETTVGLSLTYYRVGTDGSYLYTGEEAGTYVYTPELDLIDAANERIRPGDVVEIGGVQNRFLGWSPRMSDVEPLYTDHIVLEAENWGSFGARCVLYGIYEVVKEEPAATSTGDGVASATAADVAAAASTPASAPISGALDAGASQETEPFSPVGGVGVLAFFAALVLLACLLWFNRGRKLACEQGSPGKGHAPLAQLPRVSGEQQRKGGLFF